MWNQERIAGGALFLWMWNVLQCGECQRTVKQSMSEEVINNNDIQRFDSLLEI
jgi:hypothetical protein